MTNCERYRSAFAGVHAPAGAARRALAALEEGHVPSAPRRRPLRAALILAAAAVLLATTVSAEVTAGTVSNLLAPLYGGAQTELVDGIGCPVDASATVGGYTLTADAVIGDRYNIAVVYTLTRDDGAPLPTSLSFDDHETSVRRGSGGGSLSYLPGEEPNQLRIVEEWTGDSNLLFRRNARVVFRDLYGADPETREETLLVEGEWELRFALRYRDATVSVPVEDLTVTGAGGGAYQVKKILLSPLGVHMDLDIPNTGQTEDPDFRILKDFTVSLRLTDGSVRGLGNANFGYGGALDDEVLNGDYGAFFDLPIPLDEIAALDICGVQVPVENA